MILEFDIGNSRIKWRQLDESDGSTLGAGHAADAARVIAGELNDADPVMVRLCSVRGDDTVERLRQWAKRRWDLEIAVAAVSRSCGGVTNRYPDVSGLGVDRWLAMLAAYRRAGGACVVVDGGTALTIDVIDAAGLHGGGYILPGLRLMRDSLQANTAIRLGNTADTPCTALGHSTDGAVLNGTLAAVVALVESVLPAVSEQGMSARLYLSGGEGERLRAAADFGKSEVVPDLVLDGLGIACPPV